MIQTKRKDVSSRDGQLRDSDHADQFSRPDLKEPAALSAGEFSSSAGGREGPVAAGRAHKRRPVGETAESPQMPLLRPR